MNYTALYRKFRPNTFEEMVGQEHITKTLKNQLSVGRVGHAYLFNGGRGTGKTSAAKILARAVNCLNPQNGEPCNECEICKEAIAGSLTDIVEMDAASNNGVDDVRQIREEVNFLPTKAKYRVYIIDEVHMLTPGAFNALLKTLEEPPEHVKFILATTEPQKLPATILSRCQRFDFKQISNDDIIKRLKTVCDEMKIQITENALKVIAILAEGGMRDALSILERCIQDGETNIDEDKIKDLVGIPKLTYINEILQTITDKELEEDAKISNSLKIIEDIIDSGKDIQNLIWEIIKYTKDVLVYKVSKKAELYSQAEIEDMNKIANKTSKEELFSIIYQLSELENKIKYSSQKNTLLQVAIIELCISKKQPDIKIKNEKLVYKAEDINNKEKPSTKVTTINKEKQNVSESVKNASEKRVTQISEAKDGDKIKDWNKIINQLKDSGKIILYNNLVDSIASKANDLIVKIDFPNGISSFGKTMIEKSENIAEIERLLSIECGKPMKIKYNMNTSQNKVIEKKGNSIESFAQDMDIPFNIVD